MGNRIRPLSAALALAISSGAFGQEVPAAPATPVLEDIVVSATRMQSLPAVDRLPGGDLAGRAVATSDTASLLDGIPGMQVQGAGGVSGLPSLHGLGDDRLRIKVDGMDLISACANHMNSPLSYVDPSQVESLTTYGGVVPVSVGGDAIGGSVVVKSKGPRFAQAGEGLLTSGELGGFYRSNGNAFGGHLSALIANEMLSIRYDGSFAQSDNYHSAKAFKPKFLATGTTAGDHWIAGDEVGSSAYRTENHQLGVALRHENHLVDVKLAYQNIPYQGFPNQHMDMTDNESRRVNVGYVGKYAWGTLEARAYHEETRHRMNFAEDKLYWYGPSGNVPGMPMDTEGKNTGLLVKADISLTERDQLRVGGEYQRYRLNDWWNPSGGGMAPDPFININDGQRDRYDAFVEWEAQWSPRWATLLGVRHSSVVMDTGEVHGYNTTMANYAADSKAFNDADRSRTDNNLDLTALARYTANAGFNIEGGYSRKTRSPSLYERYTWSTGGMAMTMNNWVNDGNGYVGNLDLKPEVAHSISLTADWHDAARREWGVRLTPFYTYVEDYIDASATVPGKTFTPGQFNYLTLTNDDAELYGVDLSGHFPLARTAGFGSFTARGLVGYVRGKNLDTKGNLYNVMPLNARLAVEQRVGQWTNTLEGLLVAAKEDVSAVRNEMKTAGYGLLNLRSSYDTKHYRIDIGLENALDKQYSHPLGGAYIGQGRTMSLNGAGAPYGYTVPGMGRSLYLGLAVKF